MQIKHVRWDNDASLAFLNGHLVETKGTAESLQIPHIFFFQKACQWDGPMSEASILCQINIKSVYE